MPTDKFFISEMSGLFSHLSRPDGSVSHKNVPGINLVFYVIEDTVVTVGYDRIGLSLEPTGDGRVKATVVPPADIGGSFFMRFKVK